jgi:hypothetical protein
MTLVDSRNAGDCARLMVKNLIGYMRCNSKAGHPGHTDPAQIMNSPSGHTRQLIQPPFGSTESREGLSSEHREDIRPSLLCVRQYGHRLLGQVYEMGLGVFGA